MQERATKSFSCQANLSHTSMESIDQSMTTMAKPVERANFNHLVMDIAWFAIALASTSRFLQFYAIRLGADSMAVSLMTSIPSLVLVLSVGASAWWRSRYHESTKAVMWPSMIFRFVYLLPAFAPFFPLEWRVLWLILGASLPAIGQGVSSSIFLVMMRETVPSERIAPLLSRRNFALNIMLILGLLGFGFLLENVVYPLNYQIMFVIAFGFAMLSQWHLGQLHAIVPPNKPKPQSIRPILELFKTRPFQSIAYATLISHIGFFAVIGVIPVFLTNELGASESYIKNFGIVELLSGAGAMFMLEFLFKRFGTRTTMSIGLIVTAFASLAIALAPNLNFALIGAALTGAGWNVANVAILRFYTERTAANDINASTGFHQVAFTAVGLGPLIGGGLASFGLPLVSVLLIGALLRLVVGILIHFGLSIFAVPRVEPLSNLGGD
jgi:MFS family permease